MTAAELYEEFVRGIDDDKKLIRRLLASVNVQNPELDLMLDAYEKSKRNRGPIPVYKA